jgi:hypothetical protein
MSQIFLKVFVPTESVTAFPYSREWFFSVPSRLDPFVEAYLFVFFDVLSNQHIDWVSYSNSDIEISDVVNPWLHLWQPIMMSPTLLTTTEGQQ